MNKNFINAMLLNTLKRSYTFNSSTNIDQLYSIITHNLTTLVSSGSLAPNVIKSMSAFDLSEATIAGVYNKIAFTTEIYNGKHVINDVINDNTIALNIPMYALGYRNTYILPNASAASGTLAYMYNSATDSTGFMMHNYMYIHVRTFNNTLNVTNTQAVIRFGRAQQTFTVGVRTTQPYYLIYEINLQDWYKTLANCISDGFYSDEGITQAASSAVQSNYLLLPAQFGLRETTTINLDIPIYVHVTLTTKQIANIEL